MNNVSLQKYSFLYLLIYIFLHLYSFAIFLFLLTGSFSCGGNMVQFILHKIIKPVFIYQLCAQEAGRLHVQPYSDFVMVIASTSLSLLSHLLKGAGMGEG